MLPTCGVGLVVECLPSKQETRVRFSYAAQNWSMKQFILNITRVIVLIVSCAGIVVGLCGIFLAGGSYGSRYISLFLVSIVFLAVSLFKSIKSRNLLIVAFFLVISCFSIAYLNESYRFNYLCNMLNGRNYPGFKCFNRENWQPIYPQSVFSQNGFFDSLNQIDFKNK